MFPPADILIATLAMFGIAAGLGLAALWLARRRRRLSILVTAAAAAALLIHAIWLKDSLWLTRWFPLANVVVWSNIAAPAAALLAGGAWVTLRAPRWQRIGCVAALCLIGLWRQVDPVLGVPPPLGPSRWTNGVCRQSSTSACSAAAAATLVAANGIGSSEAKMIELCLTHVNGTSMLGLYRGLKVASGAAGWETIGGHPVFSELSQWPTPMIVTIGLPGNGGWIPIGNRHSIVIFGFQPDGMIDVGDPFAGRQTWSAAELQQRYGGDALTIRPKDH